MNDAPKDVLDAIETHFSDRLSVGEDDVIESIRNQRARDSSLTDRHLAKIDPIVERVSNQGRG